VIQVEVQLRKNLQILQLKANNLFSFSFKAAKNNLTAAIA